MTLFFGKNIIYTNYASAPQPIHATLHLFLPDPAVLRCGGIAAIARFNRKRT